VITVTLSSEICPAPMDTPQCVITGNMIGGLLDEKYQDGCRGSSELGGNARTVSGMIKGSGPGNRN